MQKIQFFLLFTACCLLPTSSIAQSWNEVQKIVASDRDTSDQFGRFVSISGNYAIVGAYSEDEDAAGGSPMSDAGSAYMFERDGGGNWNQVQKIVASDRAVGDQFGLSVSISGNYAIVGAWQEDPGGISNAGSAYVFERDGGGNWNEVQKIEASDRAVDDWFGSSVSISDTYAIVGAFFEDHNAAGGSFMDAAGSAYVFERDGGGSWNQVQKIVASDRFAGDFFGNSISISGNYAIVAAALADGFFGSAYVFERDGGGNWNQVQKIFASDRAWNDVFGGTVSISGNYAIVGAYLEDEDPAGGSTLDRAGSAYVFERNGGGTWNQVQKIVASDRAVDDRFGVSVSISDSHAIVGAYWEDHDAAGGSWMDFAGSAYVFERDVSGNWNQVQKIVASDRAADDWFGRSVSISGSYAIVGAYQEDHDVAGGSPMSLAGSAYLFEWGAPVLTPAFLADTVCLGDSTSFTDQTTGSPTSWLWNFDDLASGAANTSTLQNPRHLFSSSGSYDVKLVASDGSSTDSITQTVIVKPIPTADAGLNVFLCAGDSATLNATGGSIYSWTPSAGLSDTSTSNPVAQPAVTTLYTVTVTDTNGCVDSDTVRVTVAATIIADAGPDTSICFGDSIQLLASGGNNYAWTPPSTGISDTSIADPFASPGSTITYHVTVTSGSCSETDSVMITVHSLPTANAGIDDTICLGDSVTIGGSPTATGTGGYEFSWTPAATLNDSTLANPIATPTVTTTYIVIVTDTNGCQNTLSIIITVLDSVIATVTADTAICQGDSIQLTASGGATYSWFPATGLNNNSIAFHC